MRVLRYLLLRRSFPWLTSSLLLVMATLGTMLLADQRSVSTETVSKSGTKSASKTAKSPKKNANSSISDGTPPEPQSPSPAKGTADKQTGGTAQSMPSSSVCRSFRLGSGGQDANWYASQLDATSGLAVKVMGSRELFVCGPPAILDVVEATMDGVSGNVIVDAVRQNPVVRLFYFRNASQIADAINRSGGLNAPVKALGDDLLVFPSESTDDNKAIDELKHRVALIDVPRAEVQLIGWAVQVSSKDANAISDESANIRGLVSSFNQKLTNAFRQSWCYLEEQRTISNSDKNNSKPTPDRVVTFAKADRSAARSQLEKRTNEEETKEQQDELTSSSEQMMKRNKETGENQILDPCAYGFRRSRTVNTPAVNDRLFDNTFVNYLTRQYIEQPDEVQSQTSSSAVTPQRPYGRTCGSNDYCLGYTRMFSPIQPSLTNMLVALIAARHSESILQVFVDCLESRRDCKTNDPPELARSLIIAQENNPKDYVYATFKAAADLACGETLLDNQNVAVSAETNLILPGYHAGYPDDYPLCQKSDNVSNHLRVSKRDCEQEDSHFLALYPEAGPAFSCLRSELDKSIGRPRNNALLRAALADFLFHYKMSQQYPEDFVPWNRGASAQALDSLFSPLIVEFNRDLTVYLRTLQNEITRTNAKNKSVRYYSDGIVTVNVLSGTQALVNTTTQSYFPLVPYFSTRDFLNSITGDNSQPAQADSSDSESSTNTDSSKAGANKKSKKTAGGGSNLPLALSGNLSPIAAQTALAAFMSAPNQTAQIGRDLNLTVTANTLSGASSAELDVELDSSDHAPPSILDSTGKPSADNIDRVSQHTTKTRVRVESLKLFEVSSFSATLAHGRDVPLLPPFIELPYLGNLARLKLPPGTVYHRSFAIISAVLVPTAADIANAIEFHSDLRRDVLPKAKWNDPQPVSAGKQSSNKSGKPGTSPKSTSTLTVTVEQSGIASPLNIQMGCGTCSSGAGSAQPPSKDHSQDTQKDQSKTYRYWITTHYAEGNSLSEPFTVTIPAQNSNLVPVILSWEAPRDALSFNVCRVSLPDGQEEEIATEIHERTFLDGAAVVEHKFCNKETPGGRYYRIPKQPADVPRLHRHKLACIEEEADPTFGTGVENHCVNIDRLSCKSDSMGGMACTLYGSGFSAISAMDILRDQQKKSVTWENQEKKNESITFKVPWISTSFGIQLKGPIGEVVASYESNNTVSK